MSWKRKSGQPRPRSRRAGGRSAENCCAVGHSAQIFAIRARGAPHGYEQPLQLPACGCSNGSASPDCAGAGVWCARSHAAASRRRFGRRGHPRCVCSPPLAPPPLAASTTTLFAAVHVTGCACPPPRARASLSQQPTVPPLILSSFHQTAAARGFAAAPVAVLLWLPATPHIFFCARRRARVSRLPRVLLRAAPGRRRRLGQAGPSARVVHLWPAGRRGFDGGGGAGWSAPRRRVPASAVRSRLPLRHGTAAASGGPRRRLPSPPCHGGPWT